MDNANIPKQIGESTKINDYVGTIQATTTSGNTLYVYFAEGETGFSKRFNIFENAFLVDTLWMYMEDILNAIDDYNNINCDCIVRCELILIDAYMRDKGDCIYRK